MTTYTLTEARRHFPDLVEKSHRLFEEFVVSRKGIPTAVIVDYDFFESMKETLQIVTNPKLVARLRRARKEIREGRGKHWGQLKSGLGV